MGQDGPTDESVPPPEGVRARLEGSRRAGHRRRHHPYQGAGPTQPPPPSKNAGWYKDPFGTGKRYWDGSVWTEHTAV